LLFLERFIYLENLIKIMKDAIKIIDCFAEVLKGMDDFDPKFVGGLFELISTGLKICS